MLGKANKSELVVGGVHFYFKPLFNDVKTFMIHHTPLGVSTSISISGNKKINLDRKRGTMPLSQKKSFPNYVKLTPHGEGGALIVPFHPQ